MSDYYEYEDVLGRKVRVPFPKPQPPCARLGYIAPNGDFYPCAYCGHSDLADLLLHQFYEGTYGGRWSLEKKGWIGIMGGGIMAVAFDMHPTDQQKATARRVLDEFESHPEIEDWTLTFLENPEEYHLQQWFTRPDQGDFVRRLRESYELYFENEVRSRLRTPPIQEPARVRRADEHPGD